MAIPLFTVDDTGQVLLFTADKPPTPKTGHALVSLMSKSGTSAGPTAGPAAQAPEPAPATPVGA
jgi:hypothetical protein